MSSRSSSAPSPPASAAVSSALGEAARCFEYLPEPVYVVDNDRRYVVVNRAGCRAFRLPRSRILGRRIDDFMPAEVRPRMDGIWRDFVRRGRGASDLRLKVPSGWTSVFETNSRANFLPGYHLSILRDIGRRIADLARANRRLEADIVRRRATEAALRESERRYRTVFERTTSGIMIFDLGTGVVLDANRRAAQIYGHRPRDFKGLNLKQTAEDPALWRRYTTLVQRRGAVNGVEFVRRRPDGTAVQLACDAALIDVAGRPAVLAVITDVTERRRIESALRLSEGRLRAARNASLDAFYIVESVRDTRGRIVDFRFVDANRKGAALLRHRRPSLLGRNMCELFPFVRTEGVFEKFVRVVKTRRPSVELFPITVPEIRASWIQEHAVPVGDGIAITARDVSEEIQQQHALRRLSWRTMEDHEADRRRVARDLHDGVGQWLTAARFRLHAAESCLAAVGRRSRGPLAAARHELAAAKNVVASALGEVRRISHHLRPGELDDLGFAAALRGLCRETARRTGLRVVLRQSRLSRRPSRMVEDTLYRIVQEGLTNVERHARARNVWITLGQRRGQIRLAIRDDGRGFSLRRMRSSTGMGLANMQERAALGGGSFVRRSVPGQGAEIFVHLPFDSAPAASHGR